MNLYIAPNGKDSWSGKLPQPNKQATDGPLASLTQARDNVRRLKMQGRLHSPVTVWVRGGTYPLTQPVEFGPEDSGLVSYRAYKDEKPIFDGGRRIEGWRTTEVNNLEVWVADIPDVAHGQWYFRELFVNGERRRRTRWPKAGTFWMESVPGITLQAKLFEGSNVFIAREGDMQAWRNLTDVDVISRHFWVQERMPVTGFDPQSRLVTSSRKSIFCLRDGFDNKYAPYFLENVFEALTEPGEWYLDRAEGRLYYVPLPGEKMAKFTAVAPRLKQFLTITGQPEENKHVDYLCFQGLTFQYADWEMPTKGGERFGHQCDRFADYASAPQAAVNVPGAIACRGFRFGGFEDCTVRHVGYYALELSQGCLNVRVVGNHLHDMGAGGIKIDGADAKGPTALRTGNHLVTDNHIHAGGRVFEAAIGVLVTHGFGNTLAHNHIHDLYYTGISVGWVWGYAESVSRDNRIEKNHIHDIGQGLLSDMGGIYTLGVQPGTVIRGNLIHDITKYQYGGWAIYPDEGSAHLVIENNICYNTDSSCFHIHYGREITVRNNIWAFGKEGILAVSRLEPHVSCTFENNIVLTDGQPVYLGGYNFTVAQGRIRSDANLFWDVSEQVPCLAQNRKEHGGTTFTLADLRKLGHDRHSLVADPKFKSWKRRNFTLAKDSPALALGFTPIDLSDVGPRPPRQRGPLAE